MKDELARVSHTGVHFAMEPLSGSARSALAARGVLVLDVDAHDVTSDEDLLSALARALQFPPYFGESWDAADECLRDMSWFDARGYAVEVRGASLWRAAPDSAGRLIGVWLDAAENWARGELPFHLIFVLSRA